jgi:hypothetical protein
VCEAGGEFAIVRAFVDKLEPNVAVPVHPWCRCQKRLTHRADAESVAVPLVREAERSVARFESLPSESDRARTEAAKLLLEQGSALPKTVLERSARGVRKREKIQAKRATLQKRKRAIVRELKTLRTE